MNQSILWMIIAYGMSNIVVYGSIFNTPRNLIKAWGNNDNYFMSDVGKFLSSMISCMMCFGFHAGWFLSLILYSPVHEILKCPTYVSWFFDALLSSGSVWAINSIIEWFEENRPQKN